jgi:hypothetical protein
LLRVARLDFMEEDNESFPYLKAFKMRPDSNLMNNKTAYPANKMYNTEITGTGNQTAVMGAPVLASKGHYF